MLYSIYEYESSCYMQLPTNLLNACVFVKSAFVVFSALMHRVYTHV